MQNYAPLGPLAWACTGKNSDFSPPQLIRNIRRNVFAYTPEEIAAVRLDNARATNYQELRTLLDAALERAAAYCESAPHEYEGQLFVDHNEVPIEADIGMLTSGSAVALPPRDFSDYSTFSER